MNKKCVICLKCLLQQTAEESFGAKIAANYFSQNYEIYMLRTRKPKFEIIIFVFWLMLSDLLIGKGQYEYIHGGHGGHGGLGGHVGHGGYGGLGGHCGRGG